MKLRLISSLGILVCGAGENADQLQLSRFVFVNGHGQDLIAVAIPARRWIDAKFSGMETSLIETDGPGPGAVTTTQDCVVVFLILRKQRPILLSTR